MNLRDANNGVRVSRAHMGEIAERYAFYKSKGLWGEAGKLRASWVAERQRFRVMVYLGRYLRKGAA